MCRADLRDNETEMPKQILHFICQQYVDIDVCLTVSNEKRVAFFFLDSHGGLNSLNRDCLCNVCLI